MGRLPCCSWGHCHHCHPTSCSEIPHLRIPDSRIQTRRNESGLVDGCLVWQKLWNVSHVATCSWICRQSCWDVSLGFWFPPCAHSARHPNTTNLNPIWQPTSFYNAILAPTVQADSITSLFNCTKAAAALDRCKVYCRIHFDGLAPRLFNRSACFVQRPHHFWLCCLSKHIMKSWFGIFVFTHSGFANGDFKLHAWANIDTTTAAEHRHHSFLLCIIIIYIEEAIIFRMVYTSKLWEHYGIRREQANNK